MNANPKIKVVVFNHNQKKTAEKLFTDLSPAFDAAFFDSGSDADQVSTLTTHQFSNLYWSGCWNQAWDLFGQDYDVIWGVGGDCRLISSPEAFRQSIESAYPFGLWSPVVSGHGHEYMKPDLAVGRVLSVQFLEGIAFAMDKRLWKLAGPLDLYNYIGWGYDLLCSFRSRHAGMRNVLDGRVELFHPPSFSYDYALAESMMYDSLANALGPDWPDTMDWWHGRRISFPANTISELRRMEERWVPEIPFKRK